MSSEKDQIESSVASDGSPEWAVPGQPRNWPNRLQGIHDHRTVSLKPGISVGCLYGGIITDAEGNQVDRMYVLDPLDLAYLQALYGGHLPEGDRSEDQIQQWREALLARDSQSVSPVGS